MCRNPEGPYTIPGADMGLSCTDSHLRELETLLTPLTRHTPTSINSLTYVSQPELHLKHREA